MSIADSTVRANIDSRTGKRAITALAAKHRSPLDIKVPNAATQAAMAELDAGNSKTFTNIDDLMADLHADG